MYSSIELVTESVRRKLLNRLFTEMLSEIPQKTIAIDINSIDLEKILSSLNEDEILSTNDNYINELCDYTILDKYGHTLLNISPDGNVINGYSQQEYLDESLKEYITRIYDIIHRKCGVVTLTAA